MNDREYQEIVGDYLGKLDRALRGSVSVVSRKEIVDEVHQHIDEAWSASTGRSRTDLLNILDRLGEPEELAQEYSPSSQMQSSPSKDPDLLSVAAVVCTALFWPLGVILAWLSPRWLVRDKAIATFLTAGAFVFLLFNVLAAGNGGTAVLDCNQSQRSSSCSKAQIQQFRQQSERDGTKLVTCWNALQPCPPEPTVAQNVAKGIIMGFSLIGFYFVAAMFLALRRLPLPSRRAFALPFSSVVLVGASFLFITVISPLP